MPKATKKEIVTAFRTKEILAAARKLMEQRSVDAMTMDEIAPAAGVAKGTLYLYFQGKDELILTMISQVGENIIQDLESSLQTPGTHSEKLTRVVSVLLEYLDRERLLFPIYAREVLRGKHKSRKRLWWHIQEMEERFFTLTSLFSEGIAAESYSSQPSPYLLIRGLDPSTGYYQERKTGGCGQKGFASLFTCSHRV
jgi:AcrR family transcriptional regulator